MHASEEFIPALSEVMRPHIQEPRRGDGEAEGRIERMKARESYTIRGFSSTHALLFRLPAVPCFPPPTFTPL